MFAGKRVLCGGCDDELIMMIKAGSSIPVALASIMTHDHTDDLCASELGSLRI